MVYINKYLVVYLFTNLFIYNYTFNGGRNVIFSVSYIN